MNRYIKSALIVGACMLEGGVIGIALSIRAMLQSKFIRDAIENQLDNELLVNKNKVKYRTYSDERSWKWYEPLFSTRDSADKVFDKVKEIASDYGNVYASDLYDLYSQQRSSIKSRRYTDSFSRRYTDSFYGWTKKDIDSSKGVVLADKGYWKIDLKAPIKLDLD